MEDVTFDNFLERDIWRLLMKIIYTHYSLKFKNQCITSAQQLNDFFFDREIGTIFLVIIC